MLNCNVNICTHNKNGECTRENVVINLNVYDGLTPYCSDFDTSLEYVRQQYGFHKYDDETIVIVLKDCTAEILRDMAKIRKIIKEDFDENFQYMYIDSAVRTGRNAKHRVYGYNYADTDYGLAPKDISKDIVEFVNKKYPHIGNF